MKSLAHTGQLSFLWLVVELKVEGGHFLSKCEEFILGGVYGRQKIGKSYYDDCRGRGFCMNKERIVM